MRSETPPQVHLDAVHLTPRCDEYAEAALAARPAGQKMLMRMGTENARALKSKLQELRPLIGPRAAP